MRSDTIIAYFGGVPATARALDITDATVRQWGELAPPLMAMLAHCASNGELLLDTCMYVDYPRQGTVRDENHDKRIKRNRKKIQRPTTP